MIVFRLAATWAPQMRATDWGHGLVSVIATMRGQPREVTARVVRLRSGEPAGTMPSKETG